MFTLQPQPRRLSGEAVWTDLTPTRAVGGVMATSPCRGRRGKAWQGGRALPLRGSQTMGDPGESCPRSCSTPATEPGAAARVTPAASPTLASPSVNMMTMEVLLSRTLYSSRALFSILMPFSSASLMLVTGTQTDRRHCGSVSSGCQGGGGRDSRPCSRAQGPCLPICGGTQ